MIKSRYQKLKISNAFIEYSQIIHDAYDYWEDHKRKVLIVFDDMVADMEANKI